MRYAIALLLVLPSVGSAGRYCQLPVSRFCQIKQKVCALCTNCDCVNCGCPKINDIQKSETKTKIKTETRCKDGLCEPVQVNDNYFEFKTIKRKGLFSRRW